MAGTTRVYATRLLVRDFERTLRFYREEIGLSPVVGNGEPPYVELGGDRLIALFERDPMAQAVPLRPGSPDIGDTVLLGFEVDNVDAVYERLRSRGVTFVAPPTDRPEWRLRTAHLRDPEGNLVELFHNLPPAPATPREASAADRP